ncbi:MAG: hypothetical protein H7X99_04180 [Saprospiraceae bacterium]|nr:hypothetical protein [Saprospiraceae bacterium]
MASEIIGTIGIFLTLIVFLVTYFRTRHIERMALIKNEKTATIFNVNKSDSNGALKLGLLLLSIGIGLLIGLLIDNALGTEPAATFVSILICGGISLIFYHNYVENKNKSKQKDEDLLV